MNSSTTNKKGIGRFFRIGNWPIFAKILAGFIVVTFFVVLLTAGLSSVMLRDYVIDSNMTELSSKVSQAASSIAKVSSQPSKAPEFRLREIERFTGSTLIVFDLSALNTGVIYTTGQDGGDVDVDLLTQDANGVDMRLIQSILEGNTQSDIINADFASQQILYAGAPIYDAYGGISGGVILFRTLDDVRGSSVRMSMLMVAAGGLALVLAVGMAYFIGRKIADPIRAITATAQSMAEGYYGERVAVEQGGELGQLGSTLNLLSSRLSEVIMNLSDEKVKLEQILKGIGEGIVAIDRYGNVMHYNQAALELMELSALPGDIVAPGGYAGELRAMLNRAIDTGERSEIKWKSSDDRSLMAVISPIKNAENEVIGAVGLMRDVSESERLEQLRRDYVANISHELRTPLTGIRGMVEPLMDGYIDTEEGRAECYNIIYQETRRLEKLIGDMLDMSRLQDGRITIELEDLELPGIMEAAERRVRARAVECGVQLSVEYDERLPAVRGNEDRIMQVLTILLDNALSFTPGGGRITIFAREEGGWVSVGVRDTGTGIDPKDIPYIWERFYKADRSRMRTTGTGLGLSIAKLAVELMGGEISVETELNVGTVFEFTLRKV